MKLHYTHHPIFYAFTSIFEISSRITKDKFVQLIRLLGSKEVHQMYNDIRSFADKLERFLDFENTRYPLEGTNREILVSAYELQMSATNQVPHADSC